MASAPGHGGVGIIANPASARDIRRLVADGTVVTTNTKINIIKRVIAGAASTPVEQIMSMTDLGGISAGIADLRSGSAGADWPVIHFVDHEITRTEADTVAAVEAMVVAGIGAIVVIGGDGTSRVVASVCGNVPIISLSTGTNNAFPTQTEPTVAGIAAGLVASGRVSRDVSTSRAKTLVVEHGARREIAVVDIAVVVADSVASGAMWDPTSIAELFLAFAEPGAIGLSSIGAAVAPTTRCAAHGLHIVLGSPVGQVVSVPIAPGLVRDVEIVCARQFCAGERVPVRASSGVIAIDGERMFRFGSDATPTISLDPAGPFVIDADRTLTAAARDGLRAPQRPARNTTNQPEGDTT